MVRFLTLRVGISHGISIKDAEHVAPGRKWILRHRRRADPRAAPSLSESRAFLALLQLARACRGEQSPSPSIGTAALPLDIGEQPR